MGDRDIILKEILTKKYNNLDFPFYNNNPRVPGTGWILLFLSILLGFLAYLIFIGYSEFLASVVQCLIILIPLLYYAHWDYTLLFHKPDKDEIKLALIMFAGYIIYAIIMVYLLDFTAMAGTGEATADPITMVTFVSLGFNMMTEELIKFIPLMFLMRLFYRFSERKNVSFIFSAIIVMVGFGLLHYVGDTTIYSVIIIQGLGSIFEFYGYYKTKNLWVSYLSHIITDAFLMGLSLLPF